MDNHFDKNQVEKAKALAASPQGKQLLSSLMSAEPELMNKLSAALTTNDPQLLRAALSPLMESDAVKNILQQTGE